MMWEISKRSISLQNNLTITKLPASRMAFVGNFVSAGFRIELGGTILYIDPYQIDDEKPADYIFITHDHPDHFSMADIQQIAGKDTVFVCPRSVTGKLTGYSAIREVNPGDTISFGGIECEAVPAYYTKRLFLFIKSYPKTDMNVGYVMTLGGIRLYHMGDAHLTAEMRSIHDVNVAMVPVGVGAMDKKMAVSAINALHPSIAILMHYSVGRADFCYFRSHCLPDIQITSLSDEEDTV